LRLLRRLYRHFRDFFANHVTIDGWLVTGQNQNAGEEVAVEMVKLAGGKP
jgi:putative intracellular protease/amidase